MIWLLVVVVADDPVHIHDHHEADLDHHQGHVIVTDADRVHHDGTRYVFLSNPNDYETIEKQLEDFVVKQIFFLHKIYL